MKTKLAPWFSAGLLLFSTVLFSGCPKPPLTPEKPRGPSFGIKNVALACTTRTTDPAGGEVSYQFDWGDGSSSEWSDWKEGGVAYCDTHTYTTAGGVEVRARAKNRKGRVSAWSEPLIIEITPGEGEVRWRFAYPDPESPEDSADFTNHIFSIGPEGYVYIPAGDIPALMCRNPNGNRRWEFIPEEGDEISSGAAIAEDGTVYIGTEEGYLYALTPNGMKKWKVAFRSGITALPAIGPDGTVYIQTENDSAYALNPTNGSRKWSFYAGGGEQPPVVTSDAVFIAHDDTLFALSPDNGTPRWRYATRQAIASPPAIDTERDVLYLIDDDGWLYALNRTDGTEKWPAVRFPGELSPPVLGDDGTIYLTFSGTLIAVSPENGDMRWQFTPALAGDASTPAVSATGVIYFLVVGLFDRQGNQDSLYAVNHDGTRRWAAGLGVGTPGDFISAPKIDNLGYVYIGDGTRAWCVVGNGGPAPSSWPMFGGDIRNSGRVE